MAEPMHVRLAATAQRLILKHGRTLTFYETPTPADSAKPWRGSSVTPASAAGFGAVVDFQLSEIDGSVVLRGDKVCYANLPNGETNPERYVSVLDSLDSSVWRIIGVSPISPGSVVITHKLHLRQ